MSDNISMRKALDKIKEYDKIIIMRHFRPDGDAVGSTMGLKGILQLTYPEKHIYLINDDYSDYLAFMGEEDEQQDDEFYKDALGVVLDTGTADRISNKKYNLCKEIVKIDHHIDDKPYGDVSWVEDYRSSVCEMITAFYYEFKDELKIDTKSATSLYTGLITDTGRFKFAETSGETFKMAGVLIEQNIDTETLFANLYLDDVAIIPKRAEVLRRMKITENGVAYIYITTKMRKKLGLSQEDASAMVSLLDSIKGSIIWLAFIENDDKSIRVRLRSRFVEVQPLATNYHGGGHAMASGATVYSKKEAKSLILDADKLIKEYKETHTGWL